MRIRRMVARADGYGYRQVRECEYVARRARLALEGADGDPVLNTVTYWYRITSTGEGVS